MALPHLRMAPTLLLEQLPESHLRRVSHKLVLLIHLNGASYFQKPLGRIKSEMHLKAKSISWLQWAVKYEFPEDGNTSQICSSASMRQIRTPRDICVSKCRQQCFHHTAMLASSIENTSKTKGKQIKKIMNYILISPTLFFTCELIANCAYKFKKN